MEVQYKGETIGEYCADMVVNDQIIIELKCAEHIAQFHKAQLLNYLKATGYELGVLINFPNRATGFDIERVPNFIENAAEASEQIE
ncbi:MAG: GxxExxY protein [candidate division KSB1 bacterium]|nr:GxxExxY protein [candidate division KSB1 bacterium]